MYSAQRVDEKNEVICLVVMFFTLGVLPLAYFIFTSQDLQNSISCGPLFALCSSL